MIIGKSERNMLKIVLWGFRILVSIFSVSTQMIQRDLIFFHRVDNRVVAMVLLFECAHLCFSEAVELAYPCCLNKYRAIMLQREAKCCNCKRFSWHLCLQYFFFLLFLLFLLFSSKSSVYPLITSPLVIQLKARLVHGYLLNSPVT